MLLVFFLSENNLKLAFLKVNIPNFVCFFNRVELMRIQINCKYGFIPIFLYIWSIFLHILNVRKLILYLVYIFLRYFNCLNYLFRWCWLVFVQILNHVYLNILWNDKPNYFTDSTSQNFVLVPIVCILNESVLGVINLTFHIFHFW